MKETHTTMYQGGVAYSLCSSLPLPPDAETPAWYPPTCRHCDKKLQVIANRGHAYWRSVELVDMAQYICAEHEL